MQALADELNIDQDSIQNIFNGHNPLVNHELLMEDQLELNQFDQLNTEQTSNCTESTNTDNTQQ